VTATEKNYILPRSGNAPLAFIGKVIARADGSDVPGDKPIRWHELTIFETDDDMLVVSISYKTDWQGELNWLDAWFVEDMEKAVEAFRQHNPTEHVKGFPPSHHYAERQLRLLTDIRERYAALVSEVLKDFPERNTP